MSNLHKVFLSRYYKWTSVRMPSTVEKSKVSKIMQFVQKKPAGLWYVQTYWSLNAAGM